MTRIPGPAPLVLASLLSCAGSGAVAQGDFDAALADWEAILKRWVDAEGRTDFAGLAGNRAEIDRFVEFIGRVDPESQPQAFPSREQVLAYHLNAYNALAMHGVIEEGIPEGFNSFFARARFFKFRPVVIGGRRTSLYDYENTVIRPLGEPRVHFALNCMVRDCPRLPREPFRAETLDAQLEAATREFFSKDKHIRVEPEDKVLRLSEILDFYTEDFVGRDRPEALIGYVNRYRAEPVPEDFRVRFIPYDWTINRQ
jgi:hypothetical protein